MLGLITANEFVEEALDDYHSPTTSTFVEKMPSCRQTVSYLEQSLDFDREGLIKMKKAIKAIHNNGLEQVDSEQSLSKSLEKLGANAMSKDSEPDIGAAFIKFSIVTKELSSLMKALMQNLNNIVLYPLDSILKGELKGVKRKEPFERAWREYEAKILKIEKEKKQLAKEAGLIRTEISSAEIAEEMDKERKGFQLQMCEYLLKVNDIKTKKGVELLQHFVEYYHSQQRYFQDGLDHLKHFNTYIDELSNKLACIKSNQDDERKQLMEIKNLLNNGENGLNANTSNLSNGSGNTSSNISSNGNNLESASKKDKNVYNLHQLQGLNRMSYRAKYKNTSTDKVVRVITDYEHSGGSNIPDDGILAYIVNAQPEHACTPIDPPPKDPFHIISNGNGSAFNWYVLIDSSYCDVKMKLRNVKNAGYNGVIIYNSKLSSMQNELDYLDDVLIDIPVLVVTHIDGRQIKTYYTYDKGYFAWFLNNSTLHIDLYLVPFLVVIGACIIVVISFMISQIIRCYNERKQRRRHRLAKRHLKKIPTIKFRKGDHYEICAICLDEFQEGVKLRLLTCGHAYHIKCIDPWLTRNRRNCPICKGKVVVPDLTDSESEIENGNTSQRNSNANERTPLLNNHSQQGSENYSNDLIFPIGRRTRTQNSSSNNVPSTSNIVNNDPVISVQTPPHSWSVLLQNWMQTYGLSRRVGERRAGSQSVSEINSLLPEQQPTTSSAIDIDAESYISADDVPAQPTPSTSQGQSNNTYGSMRPSRRQDNIV